MNILKFLVPFGIILCSACSDGENGNSVNNPVGNSSENLSSEQAVLSSSGELSQNMPESSSAAQPGSSAIQSSSSALQPASSATQSISSAAQEPVWNAHYPITINEIEQSITVEINLEYGACRITGNGDDATAAWGTISTEFSASSLYAVERNKLKMWPEGGSEESITTYSGNSQTVYGIWKHDFRDITIKITQDSIYATEQAMSINSATDPVESKIDLANSYFIYDLYSCGTEGYSCTFGHWHFTKAAPSFMSSMITSQGIKINEQTDRSQNLTFKGKDISVRVEHVQLDSLNNGNAYMEAFIESQGVTCHFEHASMATDEKHCTTENVEYLSTYTFEGDDDNIYSSKYVKDNSDEFAACVQSLVKPQ